MSSITVHRGLVDGASYDVLSGRLELGLRLRDANGGDALVHLTPAQHEQLVDDLVTGASWREGGEGWQQLNLSLSGEPT